MGLRNKAETPNEILACLLVDITYPKDGVDVVVLKGTQVTVDVEAGVVRVGDDHTYITPDEYQELFLGK